MAMIRGRRLLRHSKWIAGALAPLVLVGGVGAGCSHEAPPDGVNQQIAALRAQVAELTLELHQPHRAPLNEAERKEALKSQERTNQARFEGQPADPELTRQAQTAFEPIIAAHAKSGKVDCHHAICRSETTHEGETSYREFIQAAFQGTKAAWLGGYTLARAEAASGGYTVVTFFGPEPTEAKTIREVLSRTYVTVAPLASTSAAGAASAAPATTGKAPAPKGAAAAKPGAAPAPSPSSSAPAPKTGVRPQ